MESTSNESKSQETYISTQDEPSDNLVPNNKFWQIFESSVLLMVDWG